MERQAAASDRVDGELAHVLVLGVLRMGTSRPILFATAAPLRREFIAPTVTQRAALALPSFPVLSSDLICALLFAPRGTSRRAPRPSGAPERTCALRLRSARTNRAPLRTQHSCHPRSPHGHSSHVQFRRRGRA